MLDLGFEAPMRCLEVRNVSKNFGGLAAVSGVSLDIIEEGEIHGLIGPNGAGKTTLLNVITGLLAPTAGSIMFFGEELVGLRPHEVAGKGIARTFQLTSLFEEFSVLENMLVAFHLSSKAGFWRSIFGTAYALQEEANFKDKALEILRFLEIEDAKDQPGSSLPYGHRKVLALGMALCMSPRLLILDEPVAGLSAAETGAVMAKLRRVRDQSRVSVLLVEHNMRAVMGACDRVSVLHFGERIATGSPEEVKRNPKVIRAYLGDESQVA